ncbi:hypothetical protein L208DRAFT_1462617 [Tricholoma matsutake]|nr:hypothetical protein L208DRAFT_1462617 [Tricholoma matsutake 945]
MDRKMTFNKAILLAVIVPLVTGFVIGTPQNPTSGGTTTVTWTKDSLCIFPLLSQDLVFTFCRATSFQFFSLELINAHFNVSLVLQPTQINADTPGSSINITLPTVPVGMISANIGVTSGSFSIGADTSSSSHHAGYLTSSISTSSTSTTIATYAPTMTTSSALTAISAPSSSTSMTSSNSFVLSSGSGTSMSSVSTIFQTYSSHSQCMSFISGPSQMAVGGAVGAVIVLLSFFMLWHRRRRNTKSTVVSTFPVPFNDMLSSMMPTSPPESTGQLRESLGRTSPGGKSYGPLTPVQRQPSGLWDMDEPPPEYSSEAP